MVLQNYPTYPAISWSLNPTNSWHTSQLTRERSRVHRRWAPCLMSKFNVSLQSSLNKGLSLLCTRITLVGTKRSTSRDKGTYNLSTGLSALQILRQGVTPIASQNAVQLTRCFRSTLLVTHKWGIACAIEMAIDSYEWSNLISRRSAADTHFNPAYLTIFFARFYLGLG